MVDDLLVWMLVIALGVFAVIILPVGIALLFYERNGGR